MAGGLIVATGLVLGGCGGPSPDAQMSAAQKAYRQSDYQRAEVQLKTLLQKQQDNAAAWLLLGRVSLARRDYDDAVHQFEQARQQGSDPADLRLPMAQALVSTDQYDRALTVLNADGVNTKDETSDTRAQGGVLRGLALLGQNKLTEARAALDHAIELAPDMPAALHARARIAEAQGDTDIARDDLNRAIANDHDDRAAQALLGRLEYRNQHCDAAVGPLAAALQGGRQQLSAADTRQPRAMLADCQLRLGQRDEAEANIKTLLAANANDPYAHYLQALVEIGNGNYQAAANHVQATLNADPNNLRSMTLMAWIRIVQGQPDTARPYLDRVLARAPDDAMALRLRAGMLVADNQGAQALDLVRQAYKRQPDAPGVRQSLAAVTAWLDTHDASNQSASSATGAGDVELQIELARSLMGLDSPAAALAVLDRIEPANAEARQRVAAARVGILLAGGSHDQAIAAAKALVAEQPTLDARLLLIDAYASAGQYAQAQGVLGAIQGQDDDDRVARVRAALALQQGDYATAEHVLTALAKTHPDDERIARQLTAVYLQTGRPEQAAQTLAALAKAHPDDDTLQQHLARLYVDTGRIDKARALIKPHLSGNDAQQAAWRTLDGIAQLARGDTAQGLATLEQAASDNSDPRAGLTLAQARLANDQTAAALEQLRAMVKNRPSFWAARALLAQAELQNGDVAAASSQVEALRSGGQVLMADVLAGDIARRRQDYAKADAAYGAAYDRRASAALAMARFEVRRAGQLDDPEVPLTDWLSQSPDSAPVALQLASWYQANGRDGAAAKVYRRLVSAQPRNPVALNNLALLSAKGDRAQAINYARSAHQAAPDSPAISDTLGWLLWQNGDHAEALSLLASAYQAAGQSAEIAYHYGIARANSPDAQGPPADAALKAALAGDLSAEQQRQARQLLQSPDSGS
ncbi:XrtA/PEP-CTERM system TPR-repeat protein PrsT [Salinisphaera sp. Q1T1-3]|uniref:XrtA/PEP-CTERM system TPR-repeat protein PrsT n=1 Tax=Salinisphaera sp. Q1T1-3 TaxID=2321229 RepID=UPI001F2E2FAB|nr:XrtA/PEP-CTERM system TPR-repeat protein PrsT [Salinisphaera sp. Q1T1-3]